MDPEWLQSTFTLCLIGNVTAVGDLTEESLRAYLENKARECKERITIEALNSIVEDEIFMEMSDRLAKSRMESLYVSYISLLLRNGPSWMTESE